MIGDPVPVTHCERLAFCCSKLAWLEYPNDTLETIPNLENNITNSHYSQKYGHLLRNIDTSTTDKSPIDFFRKACNTDIQQAVKDFFDTISTL